MKGCIFCKIANHEIPASIVYEDDDVLAFNDINPIAPVHILVIPKAHIAGVMALDDENQDIVGKIFGVIKKIAEEKGIVETGFRVVVNHGEQAGQSVFHLHYHLLGGRHLSWPPG